MVSPTLGPTDFVVLVDVDDEVAELAEIASARRGLSVRAFASIGQVEVGLARRQVRALVISGSAAFAGGDAFASRIFAQHDAPRTLVVVKRDLTRRMATQLPVCVVQVLVCDAGSHHLAIKLSLERLLAPISS